MNVVKHTQAKSKADVLQQRDSIVTADAEGLMLRRPKSKYTGNRTKDLLKVRAAQLIAQLFILLLLGPDLLHCSPDACCIFKWRVPHACVENYPW